MSRDEMAFQIFTSLVTQDSSDSVDSMALTSYVLTDKFIRFRDIENSLDPEDIFYKKLLKRYRLHMSLNVYRTLGEAKFYCTNFNLLLSNGMAFKLGETKELLKEAMRRVFDTPDQLGDFLISRGMKLDESFEL